MSEKKKDPIESLGLDEALADLKFLAQKVSDMSKDLAKNSVDYAEGFTVNRYMGVQNIFDLL